VHPYPTCEDSPIPLQIAPSFATLPSVLRQAGSSIDALYLHVPFCATKCHYCDFYSLAGHDDQVAGYLAAVDRELRLQRDFFAPTGDPNARAARPSTLFLGGGTPTLLSPANLGRLLAMLHQHIDTSAVREWTIEANPNTFTRQHAAILAEFGVNRISFGAQSFVPGELKTLQRDHDPASIPAAFAIARDAGIVNLSLDLIFGIPGQTLDSWEYSLARALEQSPSHMSCYSLTYEPTTAMTARLKRGEFQPLDEEVELQMFNHVYARLRDAGFLRYEISNYARIGENGPQICEHNLAYWKARNWMAIGPSAGAHMALPSSASPPSAAEPPSVSPLADRPVAWQWKNIGNLAHYLEALQSPDPRRTLLPITQLEALTPRQWSGAAAVFWLRLAEGLHYQEFQQRTGIDPRPPLRRALARYQALDLAECASDRARILEKGVPVSNRMLADVLQAFETAPAP
jgi:oxygen-independent coproporphyrinogen-3 oxidase